MLPIGLALVLLLLGAGAGAADAPAPYRLLPLDVVAGDYYQFVPTCLRTRAQAEAFLASSPFPRNWSATSPQGRRFAAHVAEIDFGEEAVVVLPIATATGGYEVTWVEPQTVARELHCSQTTVAPPPDYLVALSVVHRCFFVCVRIRDIDAVVWQGQRLSLAARPAE